jgi:hypothetical protein
MSNKPNIYGTCPAGCLWETVHKSDFEALATHIEVPLIDGGDFYLQIGKEYRIFSTQTGGVFDARLLLRYEQLATEKILQITHTTEDEYAESFTFKLLDVKYTGDLSAVIFVYDLDGVRTTESIGGGKIWNENPVRVFGASKVLLLNSDAQVLATTPVKGVDYWTKEDKGEIVNEVLALLAEK